MYGNNDIVKHNCFLFSLLFFCSCSWTAEQCKALFMPLSVVIRTRIFVFLFFFFTCQRSCFRSFVMLGAIKSQNCLTYFSCWLSAFCFCRCILAALVKNYY